MINFSHRSNFLFASITPAINWCSLVSKLAMLLIILCFGCTNDWYAAYYVTLLYRRVVGRMKELKWYLFMTQVGALGIAMEVYNILVSLFQARPRAA